ncbi:hypothetical protein Pmar_PMAR006630 [Perkinsus marinus ATCC 50983]|uniref:Uncharacterized protein n=1 Tax=Perkinsus marinus (strain ATCC 50983 / TXsc) TaxID=423536 RepID=C5LLT6_PERM5|nr:hypothetical protein Pmar_PMAR006630 [Perkinsus marinus ATCC 50983]EER02308.1 hypothetical protein Pmar_PMAR006630 [Perkinsus marinus ATCC 50983]|eukprot:XP_002769590.1 hypothetical protein Pmar_PMAR006630 [Perkinsus marinus ATCC 50983]
MSCGQDTSRRPIIKALSKDFVLTASQVTMLFHATVNGEFKIPLLKSLMDNIADPANALFLVEYLSKSTILTKHPTNYSTSASPISKKTLVKGKVKPTDFKLNEHYDGMPFKYGRDWILPTSGIWEFDYVSPRRALKGGAITAEAWLRVTQSIQNALDEGRLSNEVIVMCLRRVSHLFYVNCSQIDVLLAMFPQTSQNLQIRRDIFTTLYNRIVDYVDIREHFCRPRLGLPPAFGPACIAILERQIGMLNLFNPLKADNAAFKCDFNSHEGRLMAQIILRLKKTEDNRIINSRFGASLEVILPMDAPPAWYQCVPFEGYWEGTYVGTNSKMNVRKDIAMTYCAYEF